MKLIAHFLVGLAIAACVLSPCFAAASWTVTTTGVIANGYDGFGYFGEPGQDLTGLQYTQAITTSIDPATYSGGFVLRNAGSNAYLSGSTTAITDVISIGGSTHTFIVTDNVYVQNVASNGLSANKGYFDEIVTSFNGLLDGYQIGAYQTVESDKTPFVPSTDFRQSINYAIDQSLFKAIYFSIGQFGPPNEFFFNGTPTLLTVNGTNVANVPEPAPLALLGLGLVGFIATRGKSVK